MERMERKEYCKLEIGDYNQNRCLFRVLAPYVGLLLHLKTGSLACKAIRTRRDDVNIKNNTRGIR